MNGGENSVLLPRLCGADVELGNFVEWDGGPDRVDSAYGSGDEASRELLAQIKGQPDRSGVSRSGCWTGSYYTQRGTLQSRSKSSYPAVSTAYNPQDVGRRFLPSTGGSAYIDLNHLELCIPCVISAFDHVAAWHGALRIARAALNGANENRPAGSRIRVLVNNSDGLGNSYGSHLNFLVSRRLFENIVALRKPHYLQFLASFQVSSILLTGQGKVGSENGRPLVPYQLSQRADFYTTLLSIETTWNRPIVNSRAETLCGPRPPGDTSAPERLHVIFFDSAIAHGSALLRVGTMQLILTLMELNLVNPRLILDDPLVALQSYSHDPSLQTTAESITGERFTALALQSAFLEEVKRHSSERVFEGVVPRWAEIIEIWEDTLNRFAARDWLSLAHRGIDWVLKLMAIERAMDLQPGLDWNSPETKMIDLMYSSLDDGLYWSYESSGLAGRLVPEQRIAYFTAHPPVDTRAWTRAMLLRRAAEEGIEVTSCDWDRICFRLTGRDGWPSYRTFEMPDPLALTQAEAQPVFDGWMGFGELLEGLQSLGAERTLAARMQTTS
jgi:Pup amidohydrolase